MANAESNRGMGGSGALEDDAFDDVGDVFALVYGGFDDFEDFFPLDDLDGIFLFIEELGGGRNQDLDEIEGSAADAIDAIEHKSAGGGVDQIDHVVQTATEFVNVFTVKGGDEGLVQLGEEGVGNLVAIVLDSFDDLHLFRHPGVVRKHSIQGFSPHMDIGCLFCKEVKETLFARQEPLQKSWHL